MRILHLDIDGYSITSDGEVIGKKGRALKQIVDSNGYKSVRLPSGWKRVHQLLANTFIPNPNNLETVNHKDGDKLNNDLSNLEWMSRIDNLHHAMDNGLHSWGRTSVVGSKGGRSLEFESQADASRSVGTPQANINAALKGRRKTAGGYEWRYV